MRTSWYRVLLIGALALLVTVPAVNAGTRLLVSWAPGGNQVYLNDQILGDTLAGGARRDSNCTYILQRNSLYYLNRSINNSQWPLIIQAQDTAGRRPVILMDTQPGTSRPPGTFSTMSGNLQLTNLIISGYNELVPSNLGGLQGGLFNLASAGYNIIIDSCLFTNVNGQHIRTGSAAHIVKVTNTVFANMGYLGTSNLGAGKGIDFRDVSVDSAILVNNTFVNAQDRIIRHYNSTGFLNYLVFDHNTIVNSMSYHGMLSLGHIGTRAILTNNLLVDAFALGAGDTDIVRQQEFSDSRELDDFGLWRMSWLIANPDSGIATNWTIARNYYSVSDSQQAFFAWGDANPIVANPPLIPGPALTHFIAGKLGADSSLAFQQQNVALNNIPDLMMNMLRWYRTPFNAVDSGAGKSKQKTYFTAKDDFDRRSYQYFRDTLDCRYSTSSPLYTAGSGGTPVGSLTWWNMTPTGVAAGPDVPMQFALNQNYPNPFNPSTKISFTLGKSAYTTLTVYNILGQRVATLLAGAMNAGSHEVTFDARTLSSGVYFYRLESGAQVAVKKMMLVK